MRAGVTMRDPSTVYLDWTVELGRGRHPRAQRHPARRDHGRGRERHRRRQPAHRRDDRRAAPGSGRASSSRRRSRTRRRSGRSATSGRARSSAAAPRSATSPSSRTRRLGAGVEAAPHELPRRRRDRRRTSTSAPGTITANYDGTRKHPTTIGDGAFIGVDTMLVAPVDDRRGGADRRRRRRHPRRPGGQAGGRRPGPHPRAAPATARDAAGAAPPEPAPGRSGEPEAAPDEPPPRWTPPPDPGHRHPDLLRGLLRGRRDRPRDDPPDAGSTSSPTRAIGSARGSRRLVAQPGRFLAVTQLGLTFIGFLASAYAAVNLTASLETAAREPVIDADAAAAARPDRRDAAPEPVHDRLRRARAQDPGPGPHRAVRAPACAAPIDFLLPDPRSARGRS